MVIKDAYWIIATPRLGGSLVTFTFRPLKAYLSPLWRLRLPRLIRPDAKSRALSKGWLPSSEVLMTVPTEIQFVQFCIQYSSLALIYYDYFLTLELEITYVWRRPFHVLTVMFFFCRYSLVANVLFLLGLINKIENVRLITPHSQSCDTAYIVSACFGILGRIGILSIIGVRTCAVFRYNRIVIGIFTALGALVVVAAVLHVPHVSCSGEKITMHPGKRIIFRSATDLLSVSTVVFEVLSTVFVAFGCLRNMKSIGPLKAQTHSLIFLMLKEGLLYTGFVSAFTTSALILNYSAPLGSFLQRLLNALTMPISGMMTARFLLHIREWDSQDDAGDDDKFYGPGQRLEDSGHLTSSDLYDGPIRFALHAVPSSFMASTEGGALGKCEIGDERSGRRKGDVEEGGTSSTKSTISTSGREGESWEDENGHGAEGGGFATTRSGASASNRRRGEASTSDIV